MRLDTLEVNEDKVKRGQKGDEKDKDVKTPTVL